MLSKHLELAVTGGTVMEKSIQDWGGYHLVRGMHMTYKITLMKIKMQSEVRALKEKNITLWVPKAKDSFL